MIFEAIKHQGYRNCGRLLGLFAGFAAATATAAPVTDLTIEVSGDLLRYGGAIIVYHLPAPKEEWSLIPGDAAAMTVRIDARYAEIQLRYPKDGAFAYRFRPVAGSPDAGKHETQVLSLIGTDMEGRGPQMERGFVSVYSAGGHIIRVPPQAEITGHDEALRSAARWGQTEGNEAKPPADERSVRGLVSLMDGASLGCAGDEKVKVCTLAQAQWPIIEAHWWREIAEQRLDRLQYHALRRCYDSKWFGNGECEADPDSNEPAYIQRP